MSNTCRHPAVRCSRLSATTGSTLGTTRRQGRLCVGWRMPQEYTHGEHWLPKTELHSMLVLWADDTVTCASLLLIHPTVCKHPIPHPALQLPPLTSFWR